MTLALTIGKRTIKDGSRFNKYFPPESAAYGSNYIMNNNAPVEKTVKYISDIIKRDKADTAKIAPILKGKTRSETLANIHKFMVDYLQYDTEAGEKLRSPRRTWWVGQTQNDKETGDHGVDCDDLTIFAGTILLNLNIPYYIRIVKIDKNDFQHVYLIVPKQGAGLSGIAPAQEHFTIDGVLSDFDYEHLFKKEKTYDMNGVEVTYLGSIADENTDDMVLAMLENYRSQIESGQVTTTKIHHNDVLKMLNYAIENWQNETTREQSVAFLADYEKKNLPGQKFFSILQQYVDGTLTSSLSGFLGDDFSDNFSDLPKFNSHVKKWKPKKSGGGIWGAISSLFGAAANFDWGLIGGKKNQSQYPGAVQADLLTLPPAKKQIAGISLTTVAGIAMAGGLVYLAYTNYEKAKQQQKKPTARRTLARK